MIRGSNPRHLLRAGRPALTPQICHPHMNMSKLAGKHMVISLDESNCSAIRIGVRHASIVVAIDLGGIGEARGIVGPRARRTGAQNLIDGFLIACADAHRLEPRVAFR